MSARLPIGNIAVVLVSGRAQRSWLRRGRDEPLSRDVNDGFA
jgi:hypothetical protein